MRIILDTLLTVGSMWMLILGVILMATNLAVVRWYMGLWIFVIAIAILIRIYWIG
jgi:hypothetical protein